MIHIYNDTLPSVIYLFLHTTDYCDDAATEFPIDKEWNKPAFWKRVIDDAADRLYKKVINIINIVLRNGGTS